MADKYKIGPIPGFYTGEMLGGRPDVDAVKHKTLVKARESAYKYAEKYGGKHYVFSPAGYKDGDKYVVTHYFSRGHAKKKYGKMIWETTPDKKWILKKDGTLGRRM